VSAPRFLRASLLVLLILGGCVRALPPPHEPIGPDARRLIGLLIARWHGFSDLRTRADIHVQRGGERQQLIGVLLVRTPDSVRFEALSPFGYPLLMVSIDQGRLTAYMAGANEGVLGPATAETAERLLSLPFEPDDLVGVLAGRVLPPKDLRVAEIHASDAQGPSLDLIGGVHRKRIWMNFETGVVSQVEITGGRYEVRVTYLRDANDRVTGFDLTAAQAYLTGTIRYRNPTFDVGLDPERFRLTIPEGAKIERLH
jgi:outer membrane lipoprotein-sorting protein